MRKRIKITTTVRCSNGVDPSDTQCHPLVGIELLKAVTRPFHPGLMTNPYPQIIANNNDQGDTMVPIGDPLFQGLRIISPSGDVPYTVVRASVRTQYNASLFRDIGFGPTETVTGDLLGAYGAGLFSGVQASLAGIENFSTFNQEEYTTLEDNSGVSLNGDVTRSPGSIVTVDRDDTGISTVTTILTPFRNPSPILGLNMQYVDGWPLFDIDPLATNFVGTMYGSNARVELILDIEIDDTIIGLGTSTLQKIFAVTPLNFNSFVIDGFPVINPTTKGMYNGRLDILFVPPGAKQIQYINISTGAEGIFQQNFTDYHTRRHDGSMGLIGLGRISMTAKSLGSFNVVALSRTSNP